MKNRRTTRNSPKEYEEEKEDGDVFGVCIAVHAVAPSATLKGKQGQKYRINLLSPELVARTRTTELKVFAGSKVLCDLFLKLALPHLSGAILLVGTRENIERTLREG